MQRAVVLGPVTVSIVANEKFILYRFVLSLYLSLVYY